MKTAYIVRETEDMDENLENVRKEVDWFFDGDKGGPLKELSDFFIQRSGLDR